MTASPYKISRVRVRLYADIILFAAFVLVNVPQATGIPFHEWFSVLFIIPLLVHLLLDWPWIVGVTRRLLSRLPAQVRFNHLWDLMLFTVMVIAILSGILISRVALPTLGIPLAIDPFWRVIHETSANILMMMVGVHLAVHWSWVVSMFRRYIWRRPAPVFQTISQGGNSQ